MSNEAKQGGQLDGPMSVRHLADTEPVLFEVEGRARGFKNARAFRRWCRSRNVPMIRDGKMLWVRPVEVNRAFDRLREPVAARNVAPLQDNDEVSEALARKLGRKV